MYAALFNLERMANEIIADTEARYQCLADNAAAVESDISEDDKPKILWAEYFDGIGWSVAECPAWDSAYYCEYARQCGASIISRPDGVGFSESYGTSPTLYWYLTDEEFLELGKDEEAYRQKVAREPGVSWENDEEYDGAGDPKVEDGAESDSDDSTDSEENGDYPGN